jgi:hypothetical protein
MAIALVSQFYDSVKKDSSGRRTTTAGGFPILTPAGGIIFCLIFLSFGASVVSTWTDKKDAGRKEKTLSSSLEQFQKDNAGLRNDVRRLSKSSADKFDENLRRLEILRQQEETTAKETGKNIRESSSILLQHIQTGLVQPKWARFLIVFGSPRLGSKQFRRVLDGTETETPEQVDTAQEVMDKLVCAELDRVTSFELRILLSSIPAGGPHLQRDLRLDGAPHLPPLADVGTKNQALGRTRPIKHRRITAWRPTGYASSPA